MTMNKVLPALGCLLVAMALGCSQEIDESPKDTEIETDDDGRAPADRLPPNSKLECFKEEYTLRIRASIDERVRTALELAAGDWNRTLGGKLAPKFETLADDAPLKFEACTIIVRNDFDSTVSAIGRSGNLKNNRNDLPAVGLLLLYPDNFSSTMDDPVFARSFMLHELGHIVGLKHDRSLDHESIMWPFITASGVLGCEDVRRACQIWECPVTCEGTGWIK